MGGLWAEGGDEVFEEEALGVRVPEDEKWHQQLGPSSEQARQRGLPSEEQVTVMLKWSGEASLLNRVRECALGTSSGKAPPQRGDSKCKGPAAGVRQQGQPQQGWSRMHGEVRVDREPGPAHSELVGRTSWSWFDRTRSRVPEPQKDEDRIYSVSQGSLEGFERMNVS